jgi:hypothetical protein
VFLPSRNQILAQFASEYKYCKTAKRFGYSNSHIDVEMTACIGSCRCKTHLLGLGLIRSRVPFLGLLGRMGDLPGRLSELLLGARLRHRDVSRGVVVGGRELAG